MVIVDRDAAHWIETNVALAPPDHAMIRSIGQRFTQTGSLLDDAGYLIKIDETEGGSPIQFARGLIVPIATFSDSRLPDLPIVLVEDSASDGPLYKFILDGLKSLHQCKNSSFDLVHGGGSRIEDVFGEQLKTGRMVACVVDSDRCAPCPTPIPKVERMKKHSASIGNLFSFVCSTPCREAENFVPMSLYLKLSENFDRESSRKLLRIEAAERGKDPADAFWLYFDVKKGFCTDNLQSIKDKTWRNWLERKLSLTVQDLDDFRIHGFGESVLAGFLASEHLLAQFQESFRTQAWRIQFWEFFDQLLWIVFGGKRQVT
jgi:hypothetical protein